MKVFVHCWRGHASLDAQQRACRALGCPESPALKSTHWLDTVQAVESPFLLLAHESAEEKWQRFDDELQRQYAHRNDWAVIRFSLGAPAELPNVKPPHPNLAILRTSFYPFLDYLEKLEDKSRLEQFRVSVDDGRPDFSLLCPKVPDLRQGSPVGSLERWLALVEDEAPPHEADQDRQAWLRELEMKAARELEWLVRAFDPASAVPSLTAPNVSGWLQRAYAHPVLMYQER